MMIYILYYDLIDRRKIIMFLQIQFNLLLIETEIIPHRNTKQRISL